MKQNLTRVLALFLTVLALSLAAGCSSKGQYTDGTYSGTGTGMNGKVPVTVTVKGGKIAAVEVGSHSETPGISDAAISRVPKAIIDAQSPDVDAVSGATMTSKAIMDGVRQALAGGAGGGSQAAVIPMPFDKPDVIVIGAGISGLVAGVKAAELGANVLVFEQAARVGGCGNVAGGTIVAVDTVIARENGLKDTPDLLMQDFDRLGGKGNNNPVIARAYAENSGRVIDWLDQTVKVAFAERKTNDGSYQPMNLPRVHVLAAPDGEQTVAVGMSRGAAGLVKTVHEALLQYVSRGKAHIMMETKVVDIIIENDVIVGVAAQDESGKRTEYRAPSTIIATGGYGHNEAWLNEFNFKNVTTMVPPTSTGEGFDFARKAGAAFSNMEFAPAYAGSIPTGGFTTTIAANTAARTFGEPIWVDKNGRRIANETTADTQVKSDAWSAAPDNVVFILFPANAKTDSNSPISRMSGAAGWAELDKLAAEGKFAFKADTIVELARKAGISEAGLAATVDQYNRDAKAGRDTQFGRTAGLVPLETGPFYALYTVPFIMMTSGGPVTNGNAQMLRPDGSVIQGAYISGEITGMANVAGHTTIGGLGNGNAAVWGFIAAENAVANARK